MACRAEESNPIYFFMGTDFLHHLVDAQTIVFQHLKVSRVQDDFTYRFNVTLSILKEYFFECSDIERSKERDGDQQNDTGSEGEFADQTLIKRPE